MSIASEITRINGNISNAYTKIEEKGGTLPETQNSANLASAIDSISSSSIPPDNEGGTKFAWSKSSDTMLHAYLDNIDLTKYTSFDYFFYNANIETFEYTTRFTGVTTIQNMFRGATLVKSVKLNIPNCTYLANAFNTTGNSSDAEELVVNITSEYATNADSMFKNCTKLKSIGTDLRFGRAGGSVNLSSMFSGCTNLTYVPSTLISGYMSSFCTSVEVSNMFKGCSSLDDITLNTILGWCSTSFNKFVSTKTLAYLGFTESTIPASKWQSLGNYSAFTSKGWTIGY